MLNGRNKPRLDNSIYKCARDMPMGKSGFVKIAISTFN